MRRLLTIFLILFSFLAKGQSPYYTVYNYGNAWQRGIFGTTLTVPFHDSTIRTDSTRPGAILVNTVDTLPYYWNGWGWVSIATYNNLFRVTSNSVLVGNTTGGIVSSGPYTIQVTGKEAIINNHLYQGLLYFLQSDGSQKAIVDTNGNGTFSALTITTPPSAGSSTDSILVTHNGTIKSITQSSLSTTAGFALTNSPTGTLNVDSTKVPILGGQVTSDTFKLGTKNDKVIHISSNNNVGYYDIFQSGTRHIFMVNNTAGTGNRFVFQNTNLGSNMSTGVTPFQVLYNGCWNGAVTGSNNILIHKLYYWGDGTTAPCGSTWNVSGAGEAFQIQSSFIQNKIRTIISPTQFLGAMNSTTATTAPPALLYIYQLGGAATDVTCMIRGMAAQTGNLTEWRQSDSTRVAYVDPSGNIIANNLTSGTYTPTLTNVTNITASTAFVTGYYRVGTMVTVFGKIDINATLAASTSSEVGVSLPIASNLAVEQDLGGTANSDGLASESIRIKADATNDRASFVFKSISITNDSYNFQFSYQIK